MAEVICPACHLRFEAQGSEAECPDCGEVFKAAAAKPRAIARAPAPSPPTVTVKEPPRSAATDVKVPRRAVPSEEAFVPPPEVEVPKPVPVRRKPAQAGGRPGAIEEPTVVEGIVEEKPAEQPVAPPAAATARLAGLPKGPGSTADRLLARTGERRSQRTGAPAAPPVPRADIPFIPMEFHVPRRHVPPAVERAVGPWAEEEEAREVAAEREPVHEPSPAPVRPVRAPGAVAPRAATPARRRRERAAPAPSAPESPLSAAVARLRHPTEPRRTSAKPPLRTRSGLAGMLLMAVFLFGIAQAVLMMDTTIEHPEGGGRMDTVLVEVRDDNGVLVAGALVGMDGAQTETTGVAGVASLEQVSYGDHTIVVTRSNYGQATYQVTITGSSETLTVVLPRTGSRTVDLRVGTTSGASEVPAAGVLIAALSAAAFVGGVFAVRGFGRLVPAVGAIAGLGTIGFVVGPVLSLVAFMLVLSSAREFRTESRCSACTGTLAGGIRRCARCGAMYHPACADGVGDCVVCGEGL